MFAQVTNALLAVLLVGFLAGVWTQARLLKALRDRHPEVWERLGKPTLVRNNSISNIFRLRKYLRRREYIALGDLQVERIVRIQRTLELAYIFVFLLFVISFAAGLLHRGSSGLIR